MDHFERLSDEQWSQIEPLFPQIVKRSRGKPHTPWRAVTNSVLWVLFKKLKWSALPNSAEFATKSAAHRWFVAWEKNGFLQKLISCFSDVTITLPPRRQRTKKRELQEVS